MSRRILKTVNGITYLVKAERTWGKPPPREGKAVEPTKLQTYLKAFYDLMADADEAMSDNEYMVWKDIVRLKLEREERDEAFASRRPWN